MHYVKLSDSLTQSGFRIVSEGWLQIFFLLLPISMATRFPIRKRRNTATIIVSEAVVILGRSKPGHPWIHLVVCVDILRIQDNQVDPRLRGDSTSPGKIEAGPQSVMFVSYNSSVSRSACCPTAWSAYRTMQSLVTRMVPNISSSFITTLTLRNSEESLNHSQLSCCKPSPCCQLKFVLRIGLPCYLWLHLHPRVNRISSTDLHLVCNIQGCVFVTEHRIIVIPIEWAVLVK